MRRRELGLTQEHLAELIGGGLRQAEVSRLEHDKVSLPRRARLEQIATALDLRVGELLACSGWNGADVSFTRSTLEEPLHSFAGPQTGSAPVLAAPLPAAMTPEIRRLRDALARSDQLRAESVALRQRISEAQRSLDGQEPAQGGQQ